MLCKLPCEIIIVWLFRIHKKKPLLPNDVFKMFDHMFDLQFNHWREV